ncbi:hypothetical protein [Streptomyces sp. WM6378]|uniref:hypothetical protein n=1 Tax=Streptomyces sp. WM6378 TaxID=1415557 RepID=UPI00131AE9F8|nr:hypothetical protein [Streptomyces sp. WM6378]
MQEAVAELRRLHNQQHAYARTMIAPAAVRLEDGTDESSSTDVITAFTGAAPSGERALEGAIAVFHRSIGAPTRPAPRAPHRAPGAPPLRTLRVLTSTCASSPRNTPLPTAPRARATPSLRTPYG